MKIPIVMKPNLPNFREMTWADWKRWAKQNEMQLWIVVASVAVLAVALLFGIKNLAVMTALILFGALSSVFVAYSGMSFGNDFTLFGAVLGSHLFVPWMGALIVV